MSEPIHLTKRQAEALYVARETGAAYRLRGRWMGGSLRRMFIGLADQGLMGWSGGACDAPHGTITPKGSEELALWIATHPKVTLDIKALAR